MPNTNPLSDFPFTSKLSLKGLVDYWEQKIDDENPFIAESAKQIQQVVKQNPGILADSLSPEDIKKHKHLVDLLMTQVIPPTLSEGIMAAAFPPFSFDQFYSTQQFDELLKLHGSIVGIANNVPVEEILLHKTVASYMQILETFYGITVPLEKPIVLQAEHPVTGLIKYYKVDINPKFCEVVNVGEFPKLTDQEIKQLIDNLYDVDVWKAKLPPELFEFRGFSVYGFLDISTEEILSSIKESLLERDTITNVESYQKLQTKFKSLLQLSDLKIGLSGYQKSRNTFIGFGEHFQESIKFEQNENDEMCTMQQEHIINKFTASPIPVIIEDMAKSEEMMGMEAYFLEQGIKNLIIAPLYHDGEFIGLFHIGSPNVGDLSSITLTKISEVLTLLSVALKRGSDEIENRVQSVIKEQYTSIHPSVEWKFVNAAYNILAQEENEAGSGTAEEIVFKNVFPLYAASDIRNSSVERNKAIRKDLKQQLAKAKSAIKQVYKEKQLPILEELEYRIGKMSSKINKALMSGDEMTIITFLQHDVEPILRMISKEDRNLKKFVDEYWEALDPDLGLVYEARREFEQSLTQINDTISSFLDDQQKSAQDMFPHFFEKYKTDGVEYNIYIGESLSNKKGFDPVYIRNLKLWQLITTAEAAKIAMDLKPELALPLDTTHLVLVHSSPLSVKFRMDEKQFDVDGAYNMRYEIVKKRIDKALIKGTTERLTQPGKIAIVYSQEEDANEYKGYLDYMHSKGYVKDDLEELMIEELQGVSGLKALRVTVDNSQNPVISELEKMELIETKAK